MMRELATPIGISQYGRGVGVSPGNIGGRAVGVTSEKFGGRIVGVPPGKKGGATVDVTSGAGVAKINVWLN